jgi:sorting nexin-25
VFHVHVYFLACTLGFCSKEDRQHDSIAKPVYDVYFLAFTLDFCSKEDRQHDSIAKPLYRLLGEVFELRGMFKWLRRSFMTFVELTFGSNINR